eukprot:m.772330 g.772330  ORF g.772330 m.772330 type:complete len:193 (-) comp59097_c0_seq6:5276-5854(-)
MDDETRPLLATTRFANAPHVTSTNSVMSEVPFASAPTKNQLGTLNGCFVPCCMSIMSAVMFLRLGWATGEAGIIEVIGMLLVGELLTVLTALSLSAIATNGDMQGGGSYYMISRSLGPEYGGAIGLCFYLSYAFSVVRDGTAPCFGHHRVLQQSALRRGSHRGLLDRLITSSLSELRSSPLGFHSSMRVLTG